MTGVLCLNIYEYRFIQPTGNVQSMQDAGLSKEELLNGVKIEEIAIDPTFVVVFRAIDWESANFARDIQLPSSQAPTLIKYSAAEHSPVSSTPSKHIRIATPAVFRRLEPDKNSDLIADTLDSAVVDKLDWGKEGSTQMEFLKKRMLDRKHELDQINARITLTLTVPAHFMYCTSIATETTRNRINQRKHLSTNYDFMTRIDNPTQFAKQLGCDFGKHAIISENFQCDYPELFARASPQVRNYIENALTKLASTEGISSDYNSALAEAFARHKASPCAYTIHVSHGAVVYMDGYRIKPFLAGIPEFRRANSCLL